MDVGTGDGRSVLELGRRCPDTLVLGLDANAAAMAEASRRVAASPRRGGLPNVAFVLASAEDPPAELVGRVSAVTVTFPWGSLLRGVVGLDDAVTAGLVSLAAPGAPLVAILSPSDRDASVLGVGFDVGRDRPRIEDAWARAGGELCSLRAATSEEIDATGSTWAKRLGLGPRSGRRHAERVAWRLEARRPRDGVHPIL